VFLGGFWIVLAGMVLWGIGWLAGSITAGLLYAHSRTTLIAFAVVTQLLAVPFFMLATKDAPSNQ